MALRVGKTIQEFYLFAVGPVGIDTTMALLTFEENGQQVPMISGNTNTWETKGTTAVVEQVPGKTVFMTILRQVSEENDYLYEVAYPQIAGEYQIFDLPDGHQVVVEGYIKIELEPGIYKFIFCGQDQPVTRPMTARLINVGVAQ